MKCYVVSYESYSDCGDERFFGVDKVFLDKNESYKYALEKNKQMLLKDDEFFRNEIQEDDTNYISKELIFLEQLLSDNTLSNEERLYKYISLYDYSYGNLKYEGRFFEVHSSHFDDDSDSENSSELTQSKERDSDNF
jgi:hypothetical protein